MREVQNRTITTRLSNRSVTGLVIIGVLLFLFDRALKWYARVFVGVSGNENGWFGYHLNTDGPFSLPVPSEFFVLLGLLAASLLVYLGLRSLVQGNICRTTGFVLMIVGGTSNLMDRLMVGGVVDMFHAPEGLTFNMADVYLVIGVVGMLVVSGHEASKV